MYKPLGASLAAVAIIIIIAFATTANSQTCLTAGCLDNTFGNGGKALTSVNFDTGNSKAFAVAVQADRKIVVAVDAYNFPAGTDRDFYVVRYMPDGTLDTAFGNLASGMSGVSRITFDATGQSPNAVVIQTDGKIVVGGNTSLGFGIARLNTDGSLDDGGTSDSTIGDSFGTNGKVVSNYNGTESPSLWALTIDTNGKVVGCGGSNLSDNFGFFRLTTSGVYDTTFNGNGKLKVVTATGAIQSGAACHGVAIDSNGKIVGAGTRPKFKVKAKTTSADFAVMRLNTNGTLDTTFGGGTGMAFTDFIGTDDGANGMTLSLNGNIIAAGQSRTSTSQIRMALVRYLPNGTLDTGFGSGGKVTYGPIPNRSYLSFNGVTAQPDGKIIAASYFQGSPSNDFCVARFNSNGSFDNGFGTNGIAITDFNGLGDDAFALTIQPADPLNPSTTARYVVVGGATLGTYKNIGLAGYLP